MLATYMSYGVVGPSLGLYVGNLQVLWGLNRLWGLLDRLWGLYVGNTALGAVCWQPTVLWGLLTVFGAVCWQPTGLVGVVGPSLGLYVGNLQVL